MKRDVDLSRSILLYVEEYSPPQGGLDKPLEIEGYDHPTVLAHAELLIEDGLLDGRAVKSTQGLDDVHVIKLTARGHDAIAAARDNTAWNKAKKYAAEHSIPLTISALVEVIKAEIRKYIPLP